MTSVRSVDGSRAASVDDKAASLSAGFPEVKPQAVDAWEFYKAQEPYLSRNIQLADAKAGVIALSVIGIFTFLLKEGAILGSLATGLQADRLSALSAPEIGQLALSILTVLLLGLSAFFAFFTIVPRTTFADVDSQDTTLRSVVSWPDIATIAVGRPKTNAYAAAFHSLSKEEIDTQLLSSLETLAMICSSKMRLLRSAFTLAGAGFVTAFAYLCLSVAI